MSRFRERIIAPGNATCHSIVIIVMVVFLVMFFGFVFLVLFMFFRFWAMVVTAVGKVIIIFVLHAPMAVEGAA